MLNSTFSIYFAIPTSLELLPIFVNHGTPFASVRTNPYLFHPTLAEVTNLKYNIGSPSHVGINVIDPNGNFLKTIQTSVSQPAGDYEVMWDGRNTDGEIVTTTGSYTLQLSGVDDATGRTFSGNATVMVAP